MLDDLEETRYPWTNAFDFFGSGYVGNVGASHILLGWLFVLFLAGKVLSANRRPLTFRLSVLYFALMVFNNPAFSLGGLSVNELFGVAATVCFAWRTRFVGKSVSPLVGALFIVGALGFVHGVLGLVIYPELTPDMATSFTKFAVNAKVFVLAVNLWTVVCAMRDGQDPHDLVKPILSAGVAGLCLYLWQGGMLLTGNVPFGTFFDAGYIGVPSFGSVSIERGHFGKLMACYYPFFLFALLAWRWRWRFALMIAVTLINFSASSQVFFICFCALATWRFRRLLSARVLCMAGPLVALFLALLMLNFWEVFAGIGLKVYELAIQGDESSGGGRSFATFLEYIKSYPLGMGYSGSTLRTAPNLPEINAAHFAFLTQYSLLAVPILACYGVMVRRAVRRSLRGTVLVQAMGIGAMMSTVIFASDILWFTPLLWLPFVLIDFRGLRRFGRGKIRQAPKRKRLVPFDDPRIAHDAA